MLRKFGTRHRAAIGVTEETDSIAVVVSEETGQISIAARGDLEPDVGVGRVQEWLLHHTSGRPAKLESEAEPEWKRVSS